METDGPSFAGHQLEGDFAIACELVISAVDRENSLTSIAASRRDMILGGSTNGLAVELSIPRSPCPRAQYIFPIPASFSRPRRIR